MTHGQVDKTPRPVGTCHRLHSHTKRKVEEEEQGNNQRRANLAI